MRLEVICERIYSSFTSTMRPIYTGTKANSERM